MTTTTSSRKEIQENKKEGQRYRGVLSNKEKVKMEKKEFPMSFQSETKLGKFSNTSKP